MFLHCYKGQIEHVYTGEVMARSEGGVLLPLIQNLSYDSMEHKRVSAVRYLITLCNDMSL